MSLLKKNFFICKCYFANNIFLKEFEIHVSYRNKEQFIDEYAKVLQSKGCKDISSVILSVESEISRRKNVHKESLRNAEIIKKSYIPITPSIFKLNEDFFTDQFLKIIDVSLRDGITRPNLIESMKDHSHEIYSFPVFTQKFCDLFLQEIKNFESSSLPMGRPNSMNKYGINLDELGFELFISELRTNYLNPLSRIIFPNLTGDNLDTQKAFVVKYKEEQDLDLSYHYDNSEVTLNVSLNDEYTDGELYFGGMRGTETSQTIGYTHVKGTGVFHRGQHMHGALPIGEGERYNLIIWLRSSSVRNSLCPMCDSKPDLEAVDGMGDGFCCVVDEICSLT